jgi:hypothetical protein
MGEQAGRRVSWADLGVGARLFRIAHGTWGVLNLAGLGWIWLSTARRRRDAATYASAALLCVEGVALVIGRGDCPFGPFQASLGDPVPMFEWVLPPRAARAAIPVLFVIALVSLVTLFVRPPRRPG